MSHLQTIMKSWKNLLRFIPFYFSTPLLLKTLFYPWRRVYWQKSHPGFDLNETLEIFISNSLSRVMGVLIRLPMILLGMIMEVAACLFGLPLMVLLYPLFALIGKKNKDGYLPLFSLESLLKIRPLACTWHFGYTPELDKYAYSPIQQTETWAFLGRDAELQEIRRIFERRSENNVILVGEPGAGRHAILYHLSQTMFYHRFVFFNLTSLFQDKKDDGQKRGALQNILAEAKYAGNIVLVVENFEQYAGYADIWEHAIQGSGLSVAGITDNAGFQKAIFPNKTLMKYFTKVDIAPLPKEKILAILRVRAGAFQLTNLPEQALEKILEASYETQYLEDKHQPEAALDLLTALAASLPRKQHGLTASELNRFLEEKLKAPVGKLSKSEKSKLLNLEVELHSRIVNQQRAIKQIADALRRRRLKLGNENRPIGSFLFLGPTGVGKTETAKALAAIFFEDSERLIRFDMARFQNQIQVESLVDQLASAIRKSPYSVLLLDELEKAHPNLLNILLTLLDEGYFKDNDNLTVPGRNLIIIATSNAASEFIRQSVQNGTLDDNLVLEYILREKLFSPEFLNRFDGVTVYTPLSPEHLREIARMKLTKLQSQLKRTHNKDLEITGDLLDLIVSEGTHPEFGAREIDRTIERLVTDPLAQEMLQ